MPENPKGQIKDNNVEDVFLLSPMQQGLLFHTFYAPQTEAYFVQTSWTIHADLDLAALKEAWRGAMARHQILRAACVWEGREKPLQVVRRSVKLPFVEHDWRGLSTAEQDGRFEEFLTADRRRGFVLTQAPLMRLTLIRLAERTYKFVWSHHHLLMDGWSNAAVLKEVLFSYEALRRGERVELSRPRPYRDYISWLRRQDITKAEAYWREYLKGFTAPTPFGVDKLPGARNGENGDESEGASSFAEAELRLTAETTQSLRRLARQHQLTLNTLVQGAWALLLSRYSGQSDVLFGAVVAGRPAELAGVEEMVGLFINTLPVRVRVTPETPLLEWLKDLQRQQSETRAYEFSPLVEVQRWSMVTPGAPLFESIVLFENFPVDEMLREQPGSLKVSAVRSLERTSYPLTMGVGPSGERLLLLAAYETERFERAVIERMLRHMEGLLEAMAAGPSQRLVDLPLLDAAERHQLLVEWNDTASAYPADACLHQLIEEQAARTPAAVALVFENEELTYAQLNERANQLARHLRSLGVGPDVRVGVMVERSPRLLISLLGILKAGGAYVPLDPAYPRERLSFMLEDARAAVLLTEQRLAESIPGQAARVVLLDADWPRVAREEGANHSAAATPENLAYTIYTSGSTGRPKGVQIPHRAVVNFLQTMRRRPGITDRDVLAAVTSLSFDIAALELFLPLVVGAKVVLVSRAEAADGELLKHRLDRCGATIMQATPATWRLLLKAGWRNNARLKILCGGEALPRDLARLLLEQSESLWNMYGPTETTVWSAVKEVKTDGGISIGRPIGNTQLYILDKTLQPVAAGISGELYIGGDGVARGYLGRPALTAEKFIPDPFSARAGARLYHTGDVARYLTDGEIEFQGRLDDQVKVRGFRIELGEIEAVLSRHEQVQEAVVVARESAPDEKQLVAYYVSAAGSDVPARGLRSFMKDRLPEYMLPQVFVKLEEIPLTPNGKVDRKRLPAPDGQALAGEVAAPRDLLELQLARVWESVLGVRPVGINDNFFELGGHSLVAVRLFATIEQRLGVKVPLAMLLRSPTVGHLAARLRQQHVGVVRSTLVEIQGGDKGARPFFCVHPIGGNVLCYVGLARHLGAGQPFYGLQARGLDGEQAAHADVEAMAAHYVEALREVQPEGPYDFGGWSLGGVIAYEMAQQLAAAGQEVSLLAMFDSHALTGRERGVETSAATLLAHFAQDLGLSPEQLDITPQRLAALEPDEMLAQVLEAAQASGVVPADVSSHEARNLYGVFRNNHRARRDYEPKPYRGRVVLFRAGEQISEAHVQNGTGWESLAAGGVDVEVVPGDHYTMVREPHVATLAGRLKPYLAKQTESNNS